MSDAASCCARCSTGCSRASISTRPRPRQLTAALTAAELAPALAGALLAALRAKGVTAAELRGFAALHALARAPPRSCRRYADAVDIVGTGGDRSGSLNLSTGAALLAAACGLPVIKHGNRSISSRAGSADVLQALGLPMPLDEAAAGRCFAALGFTFLFAPYYHAATRAHRAGARRARRAHGVQYPRAAVQSGRAAVPGGGRLRVPRAAELMAAGARRQRHASARS